MEQIFKFSPLDVDRCRRLDASPPEFFSALLPCDAPFKPRHEGQPVAYVAAAPGETATGFPSRALADLIFAELAEETPAGTATDRVADRVVEVAPKIQELLAATPSSPLARWRGECLAWKRWIAQWARRSCELPEAECIALGLPEDLVREASQRGLPWGGRNARELEERWRDEAERDRRIRENQRREAEAAVRPNDRPCAALGVTVFGVPKKESGTKPHPALEGYTPHWSDPGPAWEGFDYIVFREVPGLAVPAGAFAGCKCLGPDGVLPAVPANVLASPYEPNAAVFGLGMQLRAQFGSVERGPVAEFFADDARIDAVRDLLQQYGRFLAGAPSYATAWRRRWLVEAIVRGFRVSLEIAVGELERFLLLEHAKANPAPKWRPNPIYFKSNDDLKLQNPEWEDVPDFVLPPYPNTWITRAELEDMAVTFAQRGDMSPGALEDRLPQAEPKAEDETADRWLAKLSLATNGADELTSDQILDLLRGEGEDARDRATDHARVKRVMEALNFRKKEIKRDGVKFRAYVRQEVAA